MHIGISTFLALQFFESKENTERLIHRGSKATKNISARTTENTRP